MLLEQFYNISLQIEELLIKKDINELSQLISRKDKIINSILKLKDVKDETFEGLVEKIKHQEEKNLILSKTIQNNITEELERINKNLKISNVYAKPAQKGSIVDITE